MQTNLTQSRSELTQLFCHSNIESLNKSISSIKERIIRQQRYIKKHGVNNDKLHFDTAWNEYKITANDNLISLHCMNNAMFIIKQI